MHARRQRRPHIHRTSTRSDPESGPDSRIPIFSRPTTFFIRGIIFRPEAGIPRPSFTSSSCVLTSIRAWQNTGLRRARCVGHRRERQPVGARSRFVARPPASRRAAEPTRVSPNLGVPSWSWIACPSRSDRSTTARARIGRPSSTSWGGISRSKEATATSRSHPERSGPMPKCTRRC